MFVLVLALCLFVRPLLAASGTTCLQTYFSAESRELVAKVLALEICYMGYESKLKLTNVDCEERWILARHERESNNKLLI